MTTPFRSLRRPALFCLAGWLALQPVAGIAEDIDIFVGDRQATYQRPNVLIVLDNTSNWSRQSQQWPGGLQQGQSEVRAIKTALAASGADFNVGVMEFATAGTAEQNGGFIRRQILEMTSANLTALGTQMDMIFSDVNGPLEKRSANTPYGNLFRDIYNYFAGSASLNPTAVEPIRADEQGYDPAYTKYRTPLNKDFSCAKNFIIFISNPNSSGPSADGPPLQTNPVYDTTAALTGRGCDTATIPLPHFNQITSYPAVDVGHTMSCYADAASCTGNVTAEFSTCFVDAANPSTQYSDTKLYNNCACTTPLPDAAACPSGSLRYSILGSDPQGTTNLGYSASCYNANASGVNACTGDISSSSYASQCSSTDGSVSCKCLETPSTTDGCSGKKRYMVQRTKTNTTYTNLGLTSACYTSPTTCSTAEKATQCATFPGGCSCGTPTSTGGTCTVSGTAQYAVRGTAKESVALPTGTYDTTKGQPWQIDEWARCMYQKGFPVAEGDNQTASTYTIDVYNKSQNADHTALMMSTAKVGGGKYFSATNEDALVNALKKIFQEITSVNSTFASASLPVNATNRSQNENQVFIGMFRPDPAAQPRWFGNLKRYQLVMSADKTMVVLGDKDGRYAINDQTGFIDDCASSFWTTDSPKANSTETDSYYWGAYSSVSPNPASLCSATAGTKQAYSDLPDGPTVEKGATAEVTRKGNDPVTAGTNENPTWLVNRTLYTTGDYASTTLLAGMTSASALDANAQSWVAGNDIGNSSGIREDDYYRTPTETRASIHGDVVHSRPLPINYNGQIVIYYGANDGYLRAIDADSGREVWAFMPYEFAQPYFVERLRQNEPLMNYPSVNMSITPTPIPKYYGWDGSIGALQNADSSKVWLYAAMRRGGNRIFALDVTSPTSPSIRWVAGCNKDGTNCTTGFSNIGQTWSTPNIGPVAGYTTEQVVFFGGGYDNCEDANTRTPNCSLTKGNRVYAVDAGSGTLLRAFTTDRAVAADIALLDIDNDGKVDYAYVADLGGNLYRIDMVRRTSVSGLLTYEPLDKADWTIRKIASSSTGGRKFQFAPALLPVASASRVYLAIASGDREHPLQTQYPYTEVTNRFYVFLDDLAVTSGSAYNLDALTNKTTDLGCTSPPVTAASTVPGWYMDLNQYGQGEQGVTTPLIAAGLVAFSTNRPLPPAEGSCASPLGEARGYWVNLRTGSGTIGVEGQCGGTRSSTFVGGGLPPSPVIGQVPVDGKPRTVIIGAVQKEGGASATIQSQKVKVPVVPVRKRAYWRLQGVD